jgi:hypothetical protein
MQSPTAPAALLQVAAGNTGTGSLDDTGLIQGTLFDGGKLGK